MPPAVGEGVATLRGRPSSASAVSQASWGSFMAGGSLPAEIELGADATYPRGTWAMRNGWSSGVSFPAVKGVGAWWGWT